MPEYEVVIQRVLVQEAVITVSGENIADAKANAKVIATSGDIEDWSAIDLDYTIEEVSEV